MSTEELRQLSGGVPITGWFFYPLTVTPLADPNFDPGESLVRDAQTASVASVSDRCFAVAAVHALNCHGVMLAALRKAERLSDIASDWNLPEVEIEPEGMVQTLDLRDEFRAAIAKAEGRP